MLEVTIHKKSKVNEDRKMKRGRKREKGQAIIEYIIIIVIVAVAALTLLGIFSDRLRQIIAGAASSFGSDNAAEQYEEQGNSLNVLKNMDENGLELDD